MRCLLPKFIIKSTLNPIRFYKNSNSLFLKEGKKVCVHSKNFSTELDIKPASHRVIVSKSKDIFENLGLEEWLYRNLDLTKCSYLLMWRNHQTVVIGRHQNSWKEANIRLLESTGVSLARRYSGGGAVYHDLGNVNFSFLAPRKRYNRKWNLNVVVDALNNEWSLDLGIDSRDCIMWNNMYKVSGTASRYDSKKSYHHFTLLLNVDKAHLYNVLQPSLSGIVGNPATPSVPASIINLKEVEEQLTFDNVVECVGHHFISRGLPIQGASTIEYVDPKDEDRYPGLQTIVTELRDWAWVYGKTPAFSLYRKFCLELTPGNLSTLELKTNIKNGIITNLQYTLSPLNPSLELTIVKIFEKIESQRLCWNLLDSLLNEFLQTQTDDSKTLEHHLQNQVVNCLRKLLFE